MKEQKKMTPQEIENKRESERLLLEKMIHIYCRGVHKPQKKGELCGECQKLSDYAAGKVRKCPFMETKTFCSACRVHCYGKTEREQIREVMRYAGPRMLFSHPVITIKHGIITLKSRKQEGRDVS